MRPEWIDSNGHMNLAYYVVVFDLGTDRLYDVLGIGNAYREATGNSCFTAETHTIYEREVKVGDGCALPPPCSVPMPSGCIIFMRCSMRRGPSRRRAGIAGAAYRHGHPARGAVPAGPAGGDRRRDPGAGEPAATAGRGAADRAAPLTPPT